MKKIELTGKYGIGKFTLVDDEDFDYLNQYKWFCHHGYVERTMRYGLRKEDKKIIIHVHREILKTPEDFETDHINGDKLDNRRKNLRTASKSQNLRNVGLRKNNNSGYKGVSFHKITNKWVAQISLNKKRNHLGLYQTPELAAKAYDQAAKEYHREFARLNF